MFTQSQPVAVVTGASSGIGRATALEFARRGFRVVVAARRGDALAVLRDEIEQLGGSALVAPVDVADREAVNRVARRTLERYGRIDVWVNNAAVSLFGQIDQVPYEEFRRVIDVNLMGYVHGMRAALPWYREHGSGVIVNVGSVVGGTGQAHASAYVATKYAIEGMGEAVRQDLQLTDADIHVCTVILGSVDTPLFQHAANHTGRAVKPMDPVYDPVEAARAIADCAARPRAVVVVGAAPRVMRAFHGLMPRTFERVFPRMVDRDHFTGEPARSHYSGNLFKPVRREELEQVTGGWRSEPSPARMAGSAALLGLAGFAVGMLLRRRGTAPQREVRRRIHTVADQAREQVGGAGRDGRPGTRRGAIGGPAGSVADDRETGAGQPIAGTGPTIGEASMTPLARDPSAADVVDELNRPPRHATTPHERRVDRRPR